MKTIKEVITQKIAVRCTPEEAEYLFNQIPKTDTTKLFTATYFNNAKGEHSLVQIVLYNKEYGGPTWNYDDNFFKKEGYVIIDYWELEGMGKPIVNNFEIY